MKKFISMIMAVAMCFSLTVPAFAAEESVIGDAEKITNVSNDDGISPLVANKEGSFALAAGGKKMFTFKMNNGSNTAHNTFVIKTSGVYGGTYKIIVTGTNGFNYATPELSSSNTHTVYHAAKDVTYTVMILNTGSTHVYGKVNITSYIA